MLRPVRLPPLPLPSAQDFYPSSERTQPGRGYGWAKRLSEALTGWGKEITDIINTGDQVQNIVPTVASAASINITAFITHVSGVAAISNIIVEKDFGGTIVLIADAAWTLALGGNIARVAAPGVNQALWLAWDHSASLWYPAI